jgi:hypothetical protein
MPKCALLWSLVLIPPPILPGALSGNQCYYPANLRVNPAPYAQNVRSFGKKPQKQFCGIIPSIVAFYRKDENM